MPLEGVSAAITSSWIIAKHTSQCLFANTRTHTLPHPPVVTSAPAPLLVVAVMSSKLSSTSRSALASRAPPCLVCELLMLLAALRLASSAITTAAVAPPSLRPPEPRGLPREAPAPPPAPPPAPGPGSATNSFVFRDRRDAECDSSNVDAASSSSSTLLFQ